MTTSDRPSNGHAATRVSTFVETATNRFTYHDLISFHLGKLDAQFRENGCHKFTARQILRNHRTALKGWLAELGADEHTVVGDEFGTKFNACLTSYLDRLRSSAASERNGLSDATLHSRKSLLRQWKVSWEEMLRSQGLPEEFSDALATLIKNSGRSISAVARAVGMELSSLHGWVTRIRHPSVASLAKVRRLEEYFALQPDTLLSRAQPLTKQSRPYCAGRTSFGRRCQTLLAERYYLRDFSSRPGLKEEWDGLVRFMSMPYKPKGKERNSRWSEDTLTKTNPTANRYHCLVASFFGFLCLSHEVTGASDLKHFDPQRLTLALLGDTELVEDYLEFRRVRAGGSHNRGTLHVLNSCCALLRAGTGYLRQHPEFGRKLSPPVSAKRWDGWCEAAHTRFTAIIDGLEEDGLIRYGRDVEEPIRGILDRQHPIDALFELADNIRADIPPAINRISRAVRMRDLLLVEMLSAMPLRIKHYSSLTYRQDNSGNLYRREDGSWALRIPPEDFKNFKRRDSKRDYCVPLPETIWQDIEAYLFTQRPLLYGAERCDFVFRPTRPGQSGKSKADAVAPMGVKCLAGIIRGLTQRYLPNCPGFGPHAFRHIIATDYVRNHPEGFEVAARVLHDRPETIREAYSHVKNEDYFAHWSRYREGRRRLRHTRGTPEEA